MSESLSDSCSSIHFSTCFCLISKLRFLKRMSIYTATNPPKNERMVMNVFNEIVNPASGSVAVTCAATGVHPDKTNNTTICTNMKMIPLMLTVLRIIKVGQCFDVIVCHFPRHIHPEHFNWPHSYRNCHWLF